MQAVDAVKSEGETKVRELESVNQAQLQQEVARRSEAEKQAIGYREELMEVRSAKERLESAVGEAQASLAGQEALRSQAAELGQSVAVAEQQLAAAAGVRETVEGQVAVEVATKAPETTTTALGADVYKLGTGLSSYDECIRARMNELDASRKTSLAAFELVAEDTATELGNARGAVKESNSKVAVRFAEVAQH